MHVYASLFSLFCEVECYLTQTNPLRFLDMLDMLLWHQSSIREMQSGLLSVEDNIADQSAFLATDDKGKCRRCRYKEICFGDQWPQLFHEDSSKNWIVPLDLFTDRK